MIFSGFLGRNYFCDWHRKAVVNLPFQCAFRNTCHSTPPSSSLIRKKYDSRFVFYIVHFLPPCHQVYSISASYFPDLAKLKIDQVESCVQFFSNKTLVQWFSYSGSSLLYKRSSAFCQRTSKLQLPEDRVLGVESSTELLVCTYILPPKGALWCPAKFDTSKQAQREEGALCSPCFFFPHNMLTTQHQCFGLFWIICTQLPSWVGYPTEKLLWSTYF